MSLRFKPAVPRVFTPFAGSGDDGFLTAREFLVVTSFHCLEHVSAPVEFARELLRATAPGGRLFLSTPYSPMSFKRDWFDVLNHPPHHMTRWNLAAYRRLAEILGVKMRHFTPPIHPWKQAWQLFRLTTYGPNVDMPKATLMKDAVLATPQLLSNWRNLRQCARQHANRGCDLILVELTAP